MLKIIPTYFVLMFSFLSFGQSIEEHKYNNNSAISINNAQIVFGGSNTINKKTTTYITIEPNGSYYDFYFGKTAKKYDSLANLLKPIDTLKIVATYKNGEIKKKGNALKFKANENVYEFHSGKTLNYYKNGQICSEILYNQFGCVVTSKYYDVNGLLVSESETTKIDTKSNNIIGFLEEKENHLVHSFHKSYLYSMKLDDIYLKSSGPTLNGKKCGKWIFYHTNGDTIRVKEYK